MENPEQSTKLEDTPKLNLYQKIVEVRKCVPFLKKDAKGYKYSYVPGISLLSAIHDKMNELGLLLIPSVSNRTYHTEIITNSRGEESKQRIIEADMLMTWIDSESGEKLEVSWLLFGEQNDISKAFGSGLTYSERYYLLKALNIPTDEDDPDAKKPVTNKTTQKPSGEISQKQREFILKIGTDNQLTDTETRTLVSWVATREKVANNHWKIGKLLLPEENFKKRMSEHIDFLNAQEPREG